MNNNPSSLSSAEGDFSLAVDVRAFPSLWRVVGGMMRDEKRWWTVETPLCDREM